MYWKFEQLVRLRGMKVSDVVKGTGIRSGVFSDWKAGRYTPKIDKLQRIADFLGVDVSVFTGSAEASENYYLNEETRRIAQTAFEDRNIRALFDAAEGCDPEALQLAIDMLKRMKGV